MQLAAVRDDRSRYEAAGVSVYAINGQSASSHRGFAQRNGFTATLLTDPGLRVAATYDAVMRLGLIKVVNRTVVGIARDGSVAYYRRGMPSTDQILGALTQA